MREVQTIFPLHSERAQIVVSTESCQVLHSLALLQILTYQNRRIVRVLLQRAEKLLTEDCVTPMELTALDHEGKEMLA
jgi:hypothetical protein